MMHDSRVSLTAALAWSAWGLSGVFVVACVAASRGTQTTTEGMVLCTIAIILAGVAATLHVRSFLCTFSHRLDNAYELGKDAGRLESVPRQRVH